jgi:multiple sugar transport system substrate-binding protein
MTTSLLSGLAARDALTPLDERLSPAKLTTQLSPVMLDAVRGVAADKKTYLAPSSANMDVLWYRQDLFSAAGLKPPATWNDFFTSASALTKDGKYGYTIRGGAGSTFPLLAEMYAYSGVTSFFDSSGASTANDPAHVEYLTKLAAMFGNQTPDADVTNSFTQMVAQFGGGSVAMLHHNLGSSADHAKSLGSKAAAVPLPQKDPKRPVIVANPVDGFAILKSSKHQDAAWTFISYLLNAETNSYWNRTVGQLPANTAANAESWIEDQEPVRLTLALLSDPATTVVSPPVYLPEYSAITKTQMEPKFQEVLLGKLTPKEYLDTLAEALTEAQAAWTKRTS